MEQAAISERFYNSKSRNVKKVPVTFSTTSSFKAQLLNESGIFGAVVSLSILKEDEEYNRVSLIMTADEAERLGKLLIERSVIAKRIAEQCK